MTIQVPGHVFSAPMAGVAVTAVQDLFFIEAAAVKPVVILRCSLTQSTEAGDAAAEMLRIQMIRRSTTGSGGTAATEVEHDTSGPAPTAAVTINRTTVGTAGDIIGEECFNVQAGFFYQPVPEERVMITPGGTIDLGFYLVGAPADSITFSGWLTWAEIG